VFGSTTARYGIARWQFWDLRSGQSLLYRRGSSACDRYRKAGNTQTGARSAQHVVRYPAFPPFWLAGEGAERCGLFSVATPDRLSTSLRCAAERSRRE